MEDGLYRRIGKNIRERRLVMEWSLQRLAGTLGISYQQLQKYEKGTNRLPSHMLVTLAAKFGCSTDELCGIQAPKYSPDLNRLLLSLALVPPEEHREIVVFVEATLTLHPSLKGLKSAKQS